MPKPREAVRWKWLIGFTMAGLLVALAAFAVAGPSRQGDVWVSLLTNAGTALALAGLLTLVERRFVKQLSESTASQVEAATRDFERRLEIQADELSTRIDQITHRVKEQEGYDSAQSENLLMLARENINYDTITALMTEANNRVAIHNGKVTIPFVHGREDCRISFSWTTKLDSSDRVNPPQLRLSLTFDPIGGRLKTPIDVTWDEGADAIQVWSLIRTRLRLSAEHEIERIVDWQGVILRYIDALTLAFKGSRRGAIGGALAEVINDRWFVTSRTLECPELDYSVDESAFPYRPFVSTFQERLDPLPQPSRPPQVADDEWRLVLARGRQYLTRGPIHTSGEPITLPWTSGKIIGKRIDIFDPPI